MCIEYHKTTQRNHMETTWNIFFGKSTLNPSSDGISEQWFLFKQSGKYSQKPNNAYLKTATNL